MSIDKAQALALADNYLDTQGADKDAVNFLPRETYSEFIRLAFELADDAKNNLELTNSVSSGDLSDSIEPSEPEMIGKVLRIDIPMLYYGKFINKGVKGVVSGRGLYQFKTLFPSRSMLASLENGKGAAQRKISNTNTKKTVSAYEKKNAKVSSASAWGAAVNIKKYGIAPTNFMDKAIVTTRDKVADRLGMALKVDIINSLPDDI